MSQFNFIGNFLGKKANLSKDGHDMSCQYAYSSNFGTFNVVDFLNVVPNEHYKCNYSGYVQTAPMREDNFAQIKNNMKAIFVPRSSMLRNHLDLLPNVTSRETRKNMQFDYDAKDFAIPLFNLVSYLWPAYFICRFYEDLCANVDDVYSVYFDVPEGDLTLGFYIQDPTSKHWISPFPVDEDGVPKNTAWSVLYHLFNAYGLDDPNNSVGAIFDEWVNACRSRSGNAICFDGLRLLDAFGYGNFTPVFDSAFKAILSDVDFSRSSVAERIMAVEDEQGFDCTITLSFYQDFFAYLPLCPADTQTPFLTINPLHLYEYQFYLQMCECSNYRSPSTNVITYDTLLNNVSHEGSSNFWIQGNNTLRMLCFDYVNVGTIPGRKHVSKFTLFTTDDDISDTLSYISGSYSMGSFEQSVAYVRSPSTMMKYLLQSANPLLQSDLFTTMQLSVVSGSVPSITSPIDVQSLNELSAAYQLKQDLLRAGVRRDKQMQSIFGVGVDELLNDIYVLDQSSYGINIQGLLNQAETDVAELGERGARGNGSSGLNFEFDSKDYGTIIIVQWFSTEIFYENFMVDKFNRLGLSQDWLPVYNNLGLEAVKALDCSMITSPFSIDSHTLAERVDEVIEDNVTLGFSARYFERKQRVSKLRGLFTNFGLAVDPALDDSNKSPWRRNFALVRGNAPFGGYVSSVIDQQTSHFSSMEDLYFNPFMVNNLFTTMNDGAAHGSFEYDQFRCFLTAAVHKVSPMPKVGLLRLI